MYQFYILDLTALGNMGIISLAAIFIPIFLIFFSTHQWNKKKKSTSSPSLPPGPPSLPIIGNLNLLIFNIKRPLHQTLADVSRRWGDVVFLRIGARPVVLISSSAAAQECFTTHDLVFAGRPRLLAGKILGYDCTSPAFVPYGPIWRNVNRVLNKELFSAPRTLHFAPIRSEEVLSLAKLLFQQSQKGIFGNFNTVQLRPILMNLTFNNIMRILIDRKRDELSKEEAEKARQFQEMINTMFAIIGGSNLQDYLPVLRWLDVQGLEQKMNELENTKDVLMQEIMEGRRSRQAGNGSGIISLLDLLLDKQKLDPTAFTDPIIKGIMAGLLAAATETTALSIEWAMALLLNHPNSLQAAKSELIRVVGRNRLVQESDFPELPYLYSIIQETLRLHPPGPLNFPHESTTECTVAGYTIPAGTMLLTNIWAIHRDPNEWEEPEEFRPERFDKSVQMEKRVEFKWIPFGAGRRACPGNVLATKMMGLALGTLIQCFDWKRVGEEMVDMEEGLGLTMPMARPLTALYRPRDDMMQLLPQVLL